MTENLPAVRSTAEVARTTQDTDSWVDVMRPVIALAERIAMTDFVPKGLRGNVAATTAAMLYGREVGLPPMTALTQTHVIEGKPAMSAEAMRALIFAAGHEIVIDESTGAVCRVRGRRAGSESWTEVMWTIDMARAAGLGGRGPWKAYPRQMLQARASTELARLVFPDVIHGFRSVEEMEDMGPDDQPLSDGMPQPPRATSRVARARKKPAAPMSELPPPAPAPERSAQPAGPPLPGEDGYADDTSTGSPDDAPTGPQPVEGGQDSEGEPVDVELIEEQQPSPQRLADEDRGRPVRPISKAQQRMLFAALSDIGIDNDDREERLTVAGTIVRRGLSSFDELTSHEGSTLIDTLARVKDKVALNALLDEIDAEVQS